MRLYAQVSGAAFSFLALAQLARFIMKVPLLVAESFTVPVWWSACAFVVLAVLAGWAFKTAQRVT
jgi:hypothetical protein